MIDLSNKQQTIAVEQDEEGRVYLSARKNNKAHWVTTRLEQRQIETAVDFLLRCMKNK